MSGRSPADDWGAALEHAAGARVTVVVGASDAGKTTLVTALASTLAARGGPVAVVDADVGQSEIGPPATAGLGRVRRRLDRLAEAELVALHFVGVTSPARDIPATIEGARRMTERARADGFERVLVDTSGLVAGGLGAALKHRKIEALDPDLVLALERDGDCDAILRRYAGRARPLVVTLAARGRPRSRTPATRRRHREVAFERYLADARLVSLDAGLVVQTRGPALDRCVGALCGLDGAGGETLALGLVQAVDATTVRVLAPLPPASAPAALRIGRERLDGQPVAPDPRSPSAEGGEAR